MKRFRFRSGHAVAAGRSHLVKGVGCQDWAGHRNVRKRSSLLALADGVGAAKFGGEGARLAVDTALGRADVTDLAELASLVREQICQVAERRGVEPNMFATTLLIARLARSSDGGVDVSTVHIGDGVIVAGGRTTTSVISPPNRGEYANLTYSVTASDWRDHAVFKQCRLAIGEGVLLMSDGPQAVLYDKRTNSAAPACGEILGWATEVKAERFQRSLARSLREVVRPATSDDLSIACAVSLL
ncbi:PP2C family serine/threonine-protein phosphatase [Mycobacterium sp. SMC-4]|uniref:PP2C family serine/threonine-protein phosphatase n=1 Tax=Mycobacterium sp. SMC-4 TaxID=2857059 RepID=UPI0021B30B85|nr:PP2C family serine/threonine-protein phosphatase [Mycobacterium sp. SMC-4]UXA17460.1 protein phosphatase 2C domain-containing protein [Mycobacterium sp. SMC-4]